jgi:hypothetical protein
VYGRDGEQGDTVAGASGGENQTNHGGVMDESAIKSKTVTRVVTPPKLRPIEPVTYPCAKCKELILDKSPCGLIEIDGEKRVICLNCAK